jgi:hypothetical protein
MKYYKLTVKNNIHNGFEFKEGSNKDINDFNPMQLEAGGFCFTDEEYWHFWVEYNGKVMYWLWECEPIDDVVRFESCYKTHKFILKNKVCIWELYQLKLIKWSSHYIKYIEEPSKKIQLEIVKDNPNYFMFIKNPTKLVQLEYQKSISGFWKMLTLQSK